MLILFLAVSAVAIGQYTGSNANIATSKLVVASDSVAGFEPGKAVDGSLLGYCAIPGIAPAWVQIDLGAYHYIDGYGMILPNAGELPKEYFFQVSADASTWTDLGTETITTDDTYGYDVVSPDPIRYVRIYMTDKDTWASFTEIYVYGYEMAPPIPPIADPATNITTSDFRANWNESAGADGYVISVATDAGFTNYVPGYDNLWVGLSQSWNITNLNPGTTYYYKVRAYNLAGSSGFGNVISLTTEKAPQTITFDALVASTYGDSDFDLTASASSGLPISYTISDETVATISGNTVTIAGTGITSITAIQEGNDQYLAAIPVDQNLVVNRKDLSVINAFAENKVYDGTTDAVISGATLDGLVGEDDVSLSNAEVGVFAQSVVGSGIGVSTTMTLIGTDTANYSFIQPSDFTADIAAKDLMVTADDKSREECDFNPEFTITYSGFVESEDISVLDQEPVATCAADANSADGTYDITVSGGSAANYVMTYISGTLTVTPDATPPSLDVQNITLQLDEDNSAVITAADLVTSASDNCSLADTTLSQSIFSESDIGDVNVDVTVSDVSGNTTTQTAVVTVQGSTGLEEVDGLQARVYPNPTYGSVHLDLNRFADELKVMDITGKTLIRKSNPEKQETIDLSGYHSGIYVIYLKFGNDVLYYKLVKK